MNKRIKKKKCIHMNMDTTIMSINERYRYMINQRTRTNAYHETMIKWYHWFTRR
jgi:hypothetical protein